jgi:hypothetical protein
MPRGTAPDGQPSAMGVRRAVAYPVAAPHLDPHLLDLGVDRRRPRWRIQVRNRSWISRQHGHPVAQGDPPRARPCRRAGARRRPDRVVLRDRCGRVVNATRRLAGDGRLVVVRRKPGGRRPGSRRCDRSAGGGRRSTPLVDQHRAVPARRSPSARGHGAARAPGTGARQGCAEASVSRAMWMNWTTCSRRCRCRTARPRLVPASAASIPAATRRSSPPRAPARPVRTSTRGRSSPSGIADGSGSAGWRAHQQGGLREREQTGDGERVGQEVALRPVAADVGQRPTGPRSRRLPP